jgi:hypothetical protein
MPEQAAHKLQETVDQITGYSRRTRRLVRGLVAVTVACVVLVVFVAFLYVRLHENQVSNCQAGNQAKVQQVRFWGEVLSLSARSSKTPPTPQEESTLKVVLHDVAVTYAPADCAARYPFW